MRDGGARVGVGGVVVGGVQHRPGAAGREQLRAAVVLERLDLGVQQAAELGGVGPAVPLHDHGLGGLVPPPGRHAWHRKGGLVGHAFISIARPWPSLATNRLRFVGQQDVAVPDLSSTRPSSIRAVVSTELPRTRRSLPDSFLSGARSSGSSVLETTIFCAPFMRDATSGSVFTASSEAQYSAMPWKVMRPKTTQSLSSSWRMASSLNSASTFCQSISQAFSPS